MRIAIATMVMLLSTGIAHASDLIGLYALIDRVTVEPSAGKPERIQIWGVFALATPNDVNYYQAPQRGYLYFQLPSVKPDLAAGEWADLKEIAGKRQVVALGSRFQLKARVRNPNEKPGDPDVYSGTGVVKLRSDTDYAPVKSLLSAGR